MKVGGDTGRICTITLVITRFQPMRIAEAEALRILQLMTVRKLQ
jgi:hypothetical protein